MKGFEALKCDFCNGGLVIDDSREFAVCEYCGTKYMKSTLVSKIQEMKIHGTVEVTTGNAEKERLIRNANKLFELGKGNEAYEAYKQISVQFPEDGRGWLGLFMHSITPKYHTCYYGSLLFSDNDSLKTACQLCKKEDVDREFETIIASYGEQIHTVKLSEAGNRLFSREWYFYDQNNEAFDPLVIDDFTSWVLFGSEEVSDIIRFEKFDLFRSKLAEQYQDLVRSGEVAPFFLMKSDNNARYSTYLLYPLNGEAVDSIEIPFPQMYDFLKNTYHMVASGNKDYKQLRFRDGRGLAEGKYEYRFVGRYLVINKAGASMRDIFLLPRNMTMQMILRSQNLCHYCGGTFKGIFTKKCSKCGRVKDY